jgi:hypothetical protein
MSKQVQAVIILVVIVLLALSTLAFDNRTLDLQTSPTPRPTKVKLPPEVLQSEQGGSTDGIVALGIAMFVIILVPILLRREEWK